MCSVCSAVSPLVCLSQHSWPQHRVRNTLRGRAKTIVSGFKGPVTPSNCPLKSASSGSSAQTAQPRRRAGGGAIQRAITVAPRSRPSGPVSRRPGGRSSGPPGTARGARSGHRRKNNPAGAPRNGTTPSGIEQSPLADGRTCFGHQVFAAPVGQMEYFQ